MHAPARLRKGCVLQLIYMSKPLHLAIIPDGNRRWAKERQLVEYAKLYSQGVTRMLDVGEAAFAYGVSHLTIWASSHANLSDRNGDFLSSMDMMYRKNITKFSKSPLVERFDIRIRVIGEWADILTPGTIKAIEDAVASTAHRRGKTLTLLINYSGNRERGAALRHLHEHPPAALPVSTAEWTALLHDHSWTAELPPVDLIIRTGAWHDPHNSAGFLSLLVDEAQYTFPAVLWPDFDTEQLHQALDDFTARERRLGT